MDLVRSTPGCDPSRGSYDRVHFGADQTKMAWSAFCWAWDKTFGADVLCHPGLVTGRNSPGASFTRREGAARHDGTRPTLPALGRFARPSLPSSRSARAGAHAARAAHRTLRPPRSAARRRTGHVHLP